MKAVVQDTYGSPDVMDLREINKPVVKDEGVLLRVRAAAVNPPTGPASQACRTSPAHTSGCAGRGAAYVVRMSRAPLRRWART